MELKDTLALITGSTGGIGAETARLFASHGAEVLVSGRDGERGEQVVQGIRDSGGNARFIQADLTDLASVRRLATEAGPVDVLINNAAIFFLSSPRASYITGVTLAVDGGRTAI